MITDVYIKFGEYIHSLVIVMDDGWSSHTRIHNTDRTPPPDDDPNSLKGRQMLWVLQKIKGEAAGEFPRA